MSVRTLEGIIENGRIVIHEDVELPESARVYVVVPEMTDGKLRIMSPRLADPSRIKEFERKVVEIDDDEI